MHTPPLFVIATACLAASAWGQGAEATPRHDLRGNYRYRAGDKLRIVERRDQTQEVRVRRGTEVVERDAQREGVEQRYVLELLEVTPEGDLLRALRTYEALTVLPTEASIPVEGIQVLFRRGDEGLRYTAEQGVTLPDELKAALEDAGDGSAPTENTGALFPEEPVAVGGRWVREPAAIAEVLGLEAVDLLPASKVEGELKEARARPGATPLLRSEVRVSLHASRFQGLVGSEPFVFELRCDLELPAGGADPAQDLRIHGEVRGKAPSPANDGTILELELDLDLTLTREALP